jgi:hypothetical protein
MNLSGLSGHSILFPQMPEAPNFPVWLGPEVWPTSRITRAARRGHRPETQVETETTPTLNARPPRRAAPSRVHAVVGCVFEFKRHRFGLLPFIHDSLCPELVFQIPD